MKKTLTISPNSFLGAILMLSISLFSVQDAQACIDPDTVITVVTRYNEDFSEIEIRLGNLKLMTEQPNVFCSCALGSFTDFFTNLEYVAFVDAGTNSVYSNMTPWENTPEASNAWESSQPNLGDWAGFIGEVINGGLAPEDDVELVIRASTPPGTFVEVVEMDSMLSLSWLGTDAWNPAEQVLFADHQGIRNLASDNSSKIFEEVTNEYFIDLDDDILSSSKEVTQNIAFQVAPNPFDQELQLRFFMETASPITYNIYNVSGKLVFTQNASKQPAGSQTETLNFPSGILQKGMYLVEIRTDFGLGVQKVMR